MIYTRISQSILILVLICILSFTSIHAQSTFTNAACFETTPTDGATGYGATIQLFGTDSQYIYPPIDFTGISPTCTSATYPGTTGECFDCSFNIDNFSEDERFRLLYAVNQNLNSSFVAELGSQVGQSVSWIRYARADQVSDANCGSLAYPRICELSLSNRTESLSIFPEFLLSIGLNTATSTVTFTAGYNKPDNWFGFALSASQTNPQPMIGYGLVWSTGSGGSGTASWQEYDITALAFLGPQTNQNLTGITNSDIDGITTWEFSRGFAADPDATHDFEFTGTETYLNIFAAVASDSGTTLASHSDANLFRATDILLTPSPADSDTQWCDPTSSVLTECWQQILPGVSCVNQAADTVNMDDIFDVTMTLCGDDSKVYIDISYPDYSGNWFGIPLADRMVGKALIYTTGFSGDNLPEALYAFDLAGYGLANVNRNAADDWTEEFTDISNGIRLIYSNTFANTGYSLSTAEIAISYALGSTALVLTSTKHSSTSGFTSPYSFSFTETSEPTGAPTTAAPTTAAPTGDDVDVCTTGTEATTTAGPFNIRGILCTDDNMFYLDVDYSAYSGDWYGIVFASGTMFGEAVAYTTGKNDDLTEGFHAYTNTQTSSAGVNLNSNVDWTEVDKDETTGLRVIYKTALGGDLGFSLTTESIPIGYAIGNDGLDITGFHTGGMSKGSTFQLLFSGTNEPTGQPTTPSPTEETARGCDKQDLVPAIATLKAFTVEFFLNCADDTVSVTITYTDYNTNWFGIVFNNVMEGPSLVYTTGKSGDQEAGLYPYDLNAKDISQVILDTENLWTQVDETIDGNTITVKYTQDLSKTEWSRETETVDVKWAYGTSLTLAQHTTTARASTGGELNLLTGEVTLIEEDLTLQIVHGVLMWLAWAILASVGIFSSAFRSFLPKGPIWFKIHRGVQASVVVIDLIGFIIAIVFTAQNGNPHFANPHMIIGLCVTILAILQPVNAWFRAHPPSDGWPGGEKPTKRVVWEWIHKGFGYITWILGCVTVMLGLLLLGEDLLAYLHMFLWCGLLLVTYIILKVIVCVRATQVEQVAGANDEETSNMAGGTTR